MNRERHALCAAAALGGALISSIATSVQSQQTKDFGVVGFGTKTCAEFGQDYKQAPERAELIYFTWVQGFMSGLNTQRFTDKLPHTNLATWELEKQQAFVREYCSNNPLVSFTKTAVQLFVAITKDDTSAK